MKRRDFLQTTAAASVLPVLLGGLPIGAYGYSPELAALTNATSQTDRVLVLIQLNGGNDGLNTVIPLDQYSALMNARPDIAIAQNQVLPLSTATGLHPAMTGLKSLYDNAKLGVVQSVGYPNPNYSHFRATDIWTSASDSNVTITSGWAGRYLDGEYPSFPTGYPSTQNPDPLAISIGSVVSNCVQGPSVNMGMAIASTASFYQLLTGGVDTAPNTPAGHELTFIRQVVSQTQVYTTAIQAAAGRARNLSPLYPAAGVNSLSDQLKIVAQLVAGGLQTRIYVCNLGGFDTHVLQVPATGSTATGTHATLLGKISQAVEAFQDDLQRLGVQDRVVGMTFSEFGRRIRANSGRGTDHGAAAPLFVFGTSVNPIIHGTNPVLPANAGVNDQIAMQFDFRAIYASLLKDWFRVPQATLNALLPHTGPAFPYVPVLRPGVATGTAAAADTSVQGFSVYPNPVREQATVAFESAGGHAQVLLFDTMGREVQRLLDRELPRGPQRLPLAVSGLAAGAYYCHVRQGSRVSSRLLTVLE
ncbi:Por secretion system C-terminal sorting domain-containing protein [Hymenobacter daecheongensis DSM 21074]|uniref:Por secretion system C-terminal sorting domain-containing protein n=1 Tax=Hymenobacter daecheongensis DSM 21074 TaxID=1121955 RepID=A0A1M6IT01_9BACT|nr:DUF1501 domain-containing protein [Hymenobacter daecheongensis]SHJ37548.1 Por secretion system C-terminal sorting domain-containing protein [Hymenobacter daecheongensis DSM 21074]